MISGTLTLLKFIGGCQVFKVFIVKIISLSVVSRQSMVSRGSRAGMDSGPGSGPGRNDGGGEGIAVRLSVFAL
jgi:hypothetical protein